MTKDKKIYERPQGDGIWRPVNDIVFEFFQTNDKECIYSKGYPGGINFEFYPNKKQLNILYPFPTFKELADLGIEFYTEHAYGVSWKDIEPDLGIEFYTEHAYGVSWEDIEPDLKFEDAYSGPDVGELKIDENLHESLIEYFVSELRYKEDSWEGGGKIFFERNSGLENYMFNNFDIEHLFNEIPSNLESYTFSADDFSSGEFDGINLCNWTVQKKFNEKGYLDIEVSIDLPKFHNEVCREISCKKGDYAIDEMFGYMNGVDGGTDDGRTYGIYCNLNFDKDYIVKNDDEIQFPWNRNS